MKVKVAKKQKASETKLLDIKKETKGMKKVLKPKKELKSAAVKAVASSVAAPLTFAKKKAHSVRRKARAPKTAPETKVKTSSSSLVTVKTDKGVKATNTKKPHSEAAEQKPQLKKKSQKKPSEKDEKNDKGVKQETKTTKSGKKTKKNKKKKKSVNNPPKPREIGPVATEVTAETLALVPKELFSRKNFEVVFEHMKKKGGKEEKNQLLGDDLKFSLQITAVKIPQVPSRNCRVDLPHSLLRKDDEVCLIVKDDRRGSGYGFQKTLDHWEDELRELGVTRVTKVIPFLQLKQDYGPYEMKLKLVRMFDRFMVDARIVGHVFAFLGKTFTKRGKNPIPVKMDEKTAIKDNIEQAMRRETYHQTNTGKQTEIKFATYWMPTKDAVANGVALMEALKVIHPGGWLNIESLHMTTACTNKQSFPLYLSQIDPNAVPVPRIVGTREAFISKQNAKVRESTGGKYEVTADGLMVKVRYPRGVQPEGTAPEGMETANDDPAEESDEDYEDEEEEPSEEEE